MFPNGLPCFILTLTCHREILWRQLVGGPKAITSFHPPRTQPQRLSFEASFGVSKWCCLFPELSGAGVLILPLPGSGTGRLTLWWSEYMLSLEMKSDTLSDARKIEKKLTSKVRIASKSCFYPAEWGLAVCWKETHLHPFASSRASTCKQYCIYYMTLFNIAFWFFIFISPF